MVFAFYNTNIHIHTLINIITYHNLLFEWHFRNFSPTIGYLQALRFTGAIAVEPDKILTDIRNTERKIAWWYWHIRLQNVLDVAQRTKCEQYVFAILCFTSLNWLPLVMLHPKDNLSFCVPRIKWKPNLRQMTSSLQRQHCVPHICYLTPRCLDSTVTWNELLITAGTADSGLIPELKCLRLRG